MKKQNLSILMIVIVALMFSYLIVGAIGCGTGDDVTAPPVCPTPPIFPPTPTPTPIFPPTPTPTPTPIWPPVTPTPTVTPTPIFPPTPTPTPTTIKVIDEKKLFPGATPDCVVFDQVWDLTQCEICISYEVDLSCIIIPDDDYEYYTDPDELNPRVAVQVGLKDHKCVGCFNPIGKKDCDETELECPCAGWMTSAVIDNDCVWNEWHANDVHYLQSKPGEGPEHYDFFQCVRPPIKDCFKVDAIDWFGFFFDRVGVCDHCRGIYGMEDGKTFNTVGKYFVELRYRALDCGLGYILASVNGVPQGFYYDKDHMYCPRGLECGECPWPDRVPDFCPIGKTFLADMRQLKLFAGAGLDEKYAEYLEESCEYPTGTHPFGYAIIRNLKVTGCPVTLPPTPTPTCTLPSCP
jgi:hypothetical protein